MKGINSLLSFCRIYNSLLQFVFGRFFLPSDSDNKRERGERQKDHWPLCVTHTRAHICIHTHIRPRKPVWSGGEPVFEWCPVLVHRVRARKGTHFFFLPFATFCNVHWLLQHKFINHRLARSGESVPTCDRISRQPPDGLHTARLLAFGKLKQNKFRNHLMSVIKCVAVFFWFSYQLKN